MVNTTTGFSLFQLKLTFSHLILLLFSLPPCNTSANNLTFQVLKEIKSDCLKAIDNLMAEKILQAYHINKFHGPEVSYSVENKVMLSTANRQQEYMQKKNGRVAKFML